MRNIAIFVLVVGFILPSFAQDEILLVEARQVREIAKQIMEVSGNSLLKENPQRAVDFWIYQSRFPNRKVSLVALPHYADDEVARHLKSVYEQAEKRRVPVSKAPLIDQVALLSVIDRFDGRLDGSLSYPDLDHLFHLVLEKRVPISSLCFGCREYEEWTDVRSLVKMDKLEKNLPKEILDLKRAAISDRDKLIHVTRILGSIVQYESEDWESDYWQTPFETLLTETGDCEDYAILMQSIAEYFGIASEIVVGTMLLPQADGRVIQVGHAWVESGGVIFDASRRTNGRANYLANIRIDSTGSHFIYESDGQGRFEGQMMAGKSN